MGRRRSDKFIPNSDLEFAAKAMVFARGIEKDPARFMLSAQDAAQITATVSEFREAMSLARRLSTRTTNTIMRKDEVRKKPEAIVRKYANQIRADERISHIDKAKVFVKQRPARTHAREVPQTWPVLTFIGSTGESGLTGAKHILKFCEQIGSGTRAKPEGAARIEVFFELVPDGAPMPRYPGQYTGGWPWYLRSFTKNPIEIEFPMPAESMLFVYWARWADATGKVGPWSRPCRARAEGGFVAAGTLPDKRIAQRGKTKCIVNRRETPRPCLEQVHSDVPLLLTDQTADVEPRGTGYQLVS